MRTDIKINTNTGDLVLSKDAIGTECAFQWITETDTHIIGEVVMPGYLSKNTIYQGVINISIPYTPIYKHVKITIKRKTYDGYEYCLNPRNNSVYFDIYNEQQQQVYASQLLMVSMDSYLLKVDADSGNCYIYNGAENELQINLDANIQNRNLLLKCVPSNNYRYPISGVGLIRYLNANISDTDLATTLQREFTEDGVRVLSAAFDSNTGEIDIDLDFGNENI